MFHRSYSSGSRAFLGAQAPTHTQLVQLTRHDRTQRRVPSPHLSLEVVARLCLKVRELVVDQALGLILFKHHIVVPNICLRYRMHLVYGLI